MAHRQSLRYLRRLKDLTQGQLADQAEIHPQTLSKIERGTLMPSLMVAQRIADALGVSVDEIAFAPRQGVA